MTGMLLGARTRPRQRREVSGFGRRSLRAAKLCGGTTPRFAKKLTFKCKHATRWLVLALCVFGTTGCAVVAVADAAVTVVATGVKVGAKAVGAVVDVVVPDGDAEK